MVLKNNSQELGGTNYNELHDDQRATVPEQIHLTPGIPNDHSMFYDSKSNTSSNYRSQESVAHPRKNIVKMTSPTLQKCPIFQYR